jgi:hypothetical protein
MPILTAFMNRNVIAAFTINLMPLAGIALFGWGAFALMLLYWLENIVIGLMTLGKILFGTWLRDSSNLLAAIPVSIFFVFHYGLFCFVHGVFVVTLFRNAGGAGGAFDLPAIVGAAFDSTPEVFWGFVFLCVAHGAMLVAWLFSGAWRGDHPIGEITRPYYRIIVLHVTLLVAGLPVMLMGEPVIGVLILALTKTGFEIYSAARDRFPIFDEAQAEASNKALEALWDKRRG